MKLFLLTILLNTLLFSSNIKNHITILLYHHISEHTPKSTSITPETFEEHLDYLHKNNYQVWDIDKVYEYLSTKKTIPKKVVSITFDDAYKSIYTNAYPLLKKYNYPFTIYINSAPIGKHSIYLTWDELNIMNKDLATFGSHSHYHNFLIRKEIDNWETTTYNDIKKSNEEILKHTGVEVNSFAYPFGEYDNELIKIVKSFYTFALGQQSGSIDYDFNTFEIPRFSMTSSYGEIERFKNILSIKPLKMTLLNFDNKIFKENKLSNINFIFSMTVDEDFNQNSLNCFDSSGEKLFIEKDFEKKEISIKAPNWKMGRQKINCTIASKSNPEAYYWYSEVFFIKSKEDEWYKP